MTKAQIGCSKETKYDFELVRVDLMDQRDSHKKPTQDETLQYLIDQYDGDTQ